MELNEFQAQVEESASMPLIITNGTLVYGGTTYPIRNISHIKTLKKEFDETEGGGWASFLLIIAIIMLFGSAWPLGLVLVIVSIIWFNKSTKSIIEKFYGLAIETNSGSNDLFYSKDQSFIEEVNNLVAKAMEGNKSINYTINIGDQKFIDNSVTNNIENKHTHIDLSINHHHGLSPEDQNFLLGDFKASIEKLYDELGGIKESVASREKLQDIVNEINSDKPNPSKIKSSWESIKKVAEGYDTLLNVGQVGTAIGTAIMMFI